MTYLTREEIKRLLRAIPNPRYRTVILVGFWHGLRASEMITLTGASIRHGVVYVERLKGSEKTAQEWISCPGEPELDEATHLAALSATVADNERLMPLTRDGLLKMIKQAGKRAGFPQHKGVHNKGIHPHILKHSIAMQTIRTAGIENVRAWLGHKSLSSTGYYLKITDKAAGEVISQSMGATVVPAR